MVNKRKTGTDYENLAADFLERKGYKIIKRNYRVRSGEIDIIAMDGRYLVFLEVKYRVNMHKGSALEAVDYRKQQTIYRTARFFLRQYHFPEEQPCRFDVIGITGDQIQHVENAFGGL